MKANIKIKDILAVALFCVGAFLAVCTADGSNHEMLLRTIGVALTFGGAWVGGWLNNNYDEEDEKEEHNPYPEE